MMRALAIVLWIVAVLLFASALLVTFPYFVDITSDDFDSLDSDEKSAAAGGSIAGLLGMASAWIPYRLGKAAWNSGVEESYECPDCEAEFTHYADYERHYAKTHDDDAPTGVPTKTDGKIKCWDCEAEFTNHDDYERHYRQAHDVPAPPRKKKKRPLSG